MDNLSTEKTILSVTDVTLAIKNLLERSLPHVSIQGEVSNFKQQSSGHLYFSLKDANAQISAVMFRNDAASLAKLPKNGDQVIIKGEINVYPPKGNYQVIIHELNFAGLGELLLKLEELKIKLHKLGWFKQERKKPLPKFPKIIGVVTSPTGAAIQDILNILTRRSSGFRLILHPVKVQGEGAAQEIAKAIEDFNKYEMADVLIVGRGGGSIEDLWAFNEEIVAQAIYNSKIPIISAVGHETDHCIADYVADLRAPTPSAAAEIVLGEKTHLLQFLQQTKHRMQQTISHLIKHDRQRLKSIEKHPFFSSSTLFLSPWMQKMDGFREELDSFIRQELRQKKLQLHSFAKQVSSLNPQVKIHYYKQKFLAYEKQLEQIWHSKNHLRKERLEKIIVTLQAIDPKNLLKNGYSIVFSEKTHSIIHSVTSLEINENARILFSDGEAFVTINQLRSK